MTIILIYPPDKAKSVIAIRKDVGIEMPTIKAERIPRAPITKIITEIIALVTAACNDLSISKI